MRRLLAALALLAAAPAVPPPVVAWHQHLLSPATAALLGLEPYDAAALLRDLDAAGIGRGVVLSMAYTYGDERKHVAYPDAATRAENDWTSAQVSGAGGRLIGFCSVNPLRDAAAAEVERCARLPGMRGLKLHFANSGVSLRVPAQAARARATFALADRLRLPIVIHFHARTGSPYGAQDARLLLALLMPAAPHVPVQIAHLAGSGLFPPETREALAVFAAAIRRQDPRATHLWFDLTSVLVPQSAPGDGQAVAAAIRAVGVGRVLFGTDLPVGGNPAPAAGWAWFRDHVALTPAELTRIARNRAPYL